MRRNGRKLLALLLALSMAISLMVTGYAAGSAAAPKTGAEGTELKLEQIDPAALNVERLGEPDRERETEDAPLHSDDDIVRISIFLDKPSTLEQGFDLKKISTGIGARMYRQTLKLGQDSMVAAINRVVSRPLDVKWNLTLAANAVSADARYGDIPAIEAMDGVQSVVVEEQFEAGGGRQNALRSSITTQYMVGAADVWAQGYTGAGTRIAIIDSGIDDTHQSFDADAFAYALAEDAEKAGKSLEDYDLLDKEEIAAAAPQLHAQVDADRAYLSAKIPFAFNYIKQNYDTDHVSEVDSDHGSHVAGIAAANRYIRRDGRYEDAISTVYAVGMAPDAQLLVMKVLGGNATLFYESDMFAAVEDAVVLGADAINLSITYIVPGFAFHNQFQKILDNIVKSGAVVSVCAGNNYNNAYSIYAQGFESLQAQDIEFQSATAPGTFTNVMSVASAENVGWLIIPLLFNGEQRVAYYEPKEYYSNKPVASLSGEYEYIYVDSPGVIYEEDGEGNVLYTDDFAALADEIEGRIVVCNRGGAPFYMKANAAMESGAAALLIANYEPGYIYLTLDGYEHDAPVASILQSDAGEIKAHADSSSTVTLGEGAQSREVTCYRGTVKVTDEEMPFVAKDVSQAELSTISAWGAPGALIMKPEITAPGGSVYSVAGTCLTGYNTYSGGPDQYVSYSGTSMAAPHVAGAAALVEQRIRENGLADKWTGGNARALMNSLIMSTAVPMHDEYGEYISILGQGAGMLNASRAVNAQSFITMGRDATDSWADGKVKAELGDQSDRTGLFTYTFDLTNMGGADLMYQLRTDLFTQLMQEYEGTDYLWWYTDGLDADVTYSWDGTSGGHDVNLDGVTNKLDAQTILDRLTGEYPEDAPYDEQAADMDGDGVSSSYDAHLLLAFLEETADVLYLPAGETATVTVNMQIENMDALNETYANGFYVEGFTYVTCVSRSDDGAPMDTEHAIPILGFCGNWTDPSMFDHSTEEDSFDKTTLPYFPENVGKDGLHVRYSGREPSLFTGNPYMTEEEYPADRLAVSSETVLNRIGYTLLRSAATIDGLITDGEGNVLFSSGMAHNVTEPYYDAFITGRYVNADSRSIPLGKTAAQLGLREGDAFTVGAYAVPEYYGRKLSGGRTGFVTEEQLAALISDGTLGRGAAIDYTMTVDDTAPRIISAVQSEDGKTLTVTLQDNHYIACASVLDADTQKTVYREIPAQDGPGRTCTVTLELSDMPNGRLILFAADYACNESAVIFTPENYEPPQERTVYTLTDTVTPGKEYVIAGRNSAGIGYLLGHGTSSIAIDEATVMAPSAGVELPYIEGGEVEPTSVWTAESTDGGFFLRNGEIYLCGAVSLLGGQLTLTSSTAVGGCVFQYNGASGAFSFITSPSRPRVYYVNFQTWNNWFSVSSKQMGKIYFYEKTAAAGQRDLEEVTAIVLSPSDPVCVMNRPVQMYARVLPLTAADRSVSWRSSDESIATVDENGLVTGHAEGEVVITAVSNAAPAVTASTTVYVSPVEPMAGAAINAQMVVDGTPYFVRLDLGDGSLTTLGLAEAVLTCGGRSGDMIIGADSDGIIYRVSVADGMYLSHNSELSAISSGSYRMIDAAHMPDLTGGTGELTLTEHYDCIYVCSGGLMMLGQRTLGGWGLPFSCSAVAYAGSDTETGVHYYWLLSGDELYLASLHVDKDAPIVQQNGTDQLNVKLSINPYRIVLEGDFYGESTMSMTMLDTEDYYGLLISDPWGGIYFADLEHVEDRTAGNDAYGAVRAVLAGDFYDECRGISTLYNDDYDAAVTPINSGRMSPVFGQLRTAAGIDGVTSLPVLQLDELRGGTAQSAARGGTSGPAAAELARTAPDVRTGGAVPAADSADEGGFTVEIREDVPATNGLYEITYDPAKLTYAGNESAGQDTYSIHVDAGQGVITLAFADLEPAAAGETVATVTFRPSCQDSVVTVTTRERGDELELNETETLDCAGTGHDWDEPTYTWSGDNSAVTARRVCKNDSSHVEEETVKTTAETAEPTCEKDGRTTYKAAFTNGAFREQTKEETIPATGHDWGEPVWTWSDDHKTATATFTCANCGEKYAVTDDAILTETDQDGRITYTAGIIGPDGRIYTATAGGVPTGDAVDLTLHAGLMAVSAAGVWLLLRSLRKKEN